MVKVPVGKRASGKEIDTMLGIMEEVGKVEQPVEFRKTIIKGLPRTVLKNKEYITRYLLLVAILDQQAESPTARMAAKFVYDTYGTTLFNDPEKVMLNFEKLKPLDSEKIYKISPAIGRVTPRFAWITLRVGGFLIYELKLNKEKISISEKLSGLSSPAKAMEYLTSSDILQSLLREKALRMYLSWVGHPDLGIDISGGKWKPASFLMPINGHVGKVFSRTGIVEEVNVETIKEGSPRKDIIFASKMRDPIQEVVSSRGFDSVRVDHGAFVIGIQCCSDKARIPEEAGCYVCDKPSFKGHCPLRDHCQKNMRWHAY